MKQDSIQSDVTIRMQTQDNESVIIHVQGPLCFATVPAAYQQTKKCFDGQREVRVDLANVQRSDSAALALVLEWQRLANETGATLILQNIPSMLQNIARISDLEEMLPA